MADDKIKITADVELEISKAVAKKFQDEIRNILTESFGSAGFDKFFFSRQAELAGKIHKAYNRNLRYRNIAAENAANAQADFYALSGMDLGTAQTYASSITKAINAARTRAMQEQLVVAPEEANVLFSVAKQIQAASKAATLEKNLETKTARQIAQEKNAENALAFRMSETASARAAKRAAAEAQAVEKEAALTAKRQEEELIALGERHADEELWHGQMATIYEESLARKERRRIKESIEASRTGRRWESASETLARVKAKLTGKVSVEAIDASLAGMSAENRAAFARMYREQNAGIYWNQRFSNSVQQLTDGGMNSEARAYFSDRYGELGKSIQKTRKELNKFSIALGKAAIAGVNATTAIMEGRTSWLANTIDPLGTRRDVMQGWAISAGDAAMGLGMAGLSSGVAPVMIAGGAVMAAGGLAKILGQHYKDEKKLEDVYGLKSAKAVNAYTLYGAKSGLGAAEMIGTTGAASEASVFGLNTTKAMLPGAMAMGGVSEQQYVALSHFPNYWNAIMSGASPMEMLAAYRQDVQGLPPEMVPYLTSMLPGMSEELRGFATGPSFGTALASSGAMEANDIAEYERSVSGANFIMNRQIGSRLEATQNFLTQNPNGLFGEDVGIVGPVVEAFREVAEKLALRPFNITINVDGEQKTTQTIRQKSVEENMTIYMS